MPRFLKLTTQSYNKPAVVLVNIDHILTIDAVNEGQNSTQWYKTIIYMKSMGGDAATCTMVYEDIDTIMRGLPL